MNELKLQLEALLFSQSEPLSIEDMRSSFLELQRPSPDEIKLGLSLLQEDYISRSIELREVASGWRFHTRPAFSPWIMRLSQQKPPTYSRAFLETLAIIAYRQPITRSEIEEIRGVTLNSEYLKTMLSREWIYVAGQKEVPGKPNIYKTTQQFLDYFNLKNLDELPLLEKVEMS